MENLETLFEKVKKDIQDGKSIEEILQSTLSFFGQDQEADGQLVKQLGNVIHIEAAKLLYRLLDVSKEKTVRKIIKQSLYRLKSKGVAFEEIQPKKEESILRMMPIEPSQGYGGSFDFLGDRLLMLGIPYFGRGLIVLYGLASDTKGWVEFYGRKMSRKGFRDFFEEVRRSSPLPMVEMEASYVGFLFVQTYQLTLDQKGKPPEDYLSFKNEIEKIKKEYERPIIYSFIEEEKMVKDDWMLKRGGDLLKADLFASWRVEEDQIRPYADAVWETERSKLILSKMQKEARIEEIYQKAMLELFPEQRRSLYKRRLEEMAYLLLKLGREEEAKASLATAIDLKKEINPIQPNPFLLNLVIKSISIILSETDEKEKKELSLIVRP